MQYIPLTSTGNCSTSVTLSTGNFSLLTRYNYQAKCWTLDITDTNLNDVVLGIMLVPGVLLLHAYPYVKSSFGDIFLVETVTGSYMIPDNLGKTNFLIWIAPDEMVI